MSKSIANILRYQIIPAINQFGLSQCIVARNTLSEMPRRPAFRYSPRQVLGSRRGVRSFTLSEVTAKWPIDHLVESLNPILTFVTAGKADMPFRDYWLHAGEGQGVFTLANVPRKDGKVPYLQPSRQKDGACATINFMEVRGRVHIWHNRSVGKTHQTSTDIPSVYMINDRGAQLLRQLQFHFEQAGSDDDAVCLHLLKAFLFTMQKDLRTEQFVQAGLLRGTRHNEASGYNPICRAQEYIRSHLHEPLTLQSVAREVRMARTQFALDFKQKTGQTFNEFVTRCRIEQAKVLLEETDYTLVFVCTSIGYRTPAYFNKIFLRHTGMTPQRYRKEMTLKNEEQ